MRRDHAYPTVVSVPAEEHSGPGVDASAGTWRQPLPHLTNPGDRLLCRVVTGFARTRFVAVDGIDNVRPELDPFIFVCNHNQRSEALLLPTLLIFHRGGKLIHFLADWPTLLVPGASLLLRRSQVIVVPTKRPRFRFLAPLRRFWARVPAPSRQALTRLKSGASVGIFPEGTMNRDPARLLRGHPGAARLSILSGAPVVPAGLSFPDHVGDGPIADGARMRLRIGPPIHPPPAAGQERRAEDVARLHRRLMHEISRLCGKRWAEERARKEWA